MDCYFVVAIIEFLVYSVNGSFAEGAVGRLFLQVLACVFCALGCASQEEVCFKNIRQVTFRSMGFEKAGEAYFSPDGRSLIFQAVPEGEKSYQIYTMRLQGGAPQRVSAGKGACTCGFYRPDGKKILFASSHEAPDVQVEKKEEAGRYRWDLTPYMNIYEADLDGSCLKKLTSGPAYHAECAFSSDGKEIVYASDEGGSMNLYICDAEGAHVRRVTRTERCYNGGPFFSPNGEWIVFRADREAKDLLQIYLIRPDGSEEGS